MSLLSAKTFVLFPSPSNLHKPSPPYLHNTPKFPRNLSSLYASSSSSFQSSTISLLRDDDDDDDDEHVIGDCVVFEDGAFDDPNLQTDFNLDKLDDDTEAKPKPKRNRKKQVVEIEPENLVPEKWSEVVAEINITKKERRKIAQEMEFGCKIEKKKQGLVPIRDVNIGEYLSYREAKLAELKPLVLDNPSSFGRAKVSDEPREGRAAPKNPRWAVYGKGLDDVNDFFNQYDPTEKNPEGRRKLFTKEEKYMLNRRVPDLTAATSGKWLPLHTLAASGEFYLLDILLKHNVDINAMDTNGLTAIHKAITCKKQAITEFLLRESANPFVRDEGGATLMHYAVQTASSRAIKILLLYNVDINMQDNDGWTPLHLAVLGRRTDVVRLLLIKGADKTLRNQDGLTPLDLCLYSGQDAKTYELIKLLKQLPKPRKLFH